MKRFVIFIYYLFVALIAHAEIESDGNTMIDSINNVMSVNTNELVNMLDADPNILLIDVRTEYEVLDLGRINRGQNRNVPRGRLEFEVNELPGIDESTTIIVYSNESKRSILAAKKLEVMGYNNVINYADGYNAWKDSGQPVWLSDMEPDSILYRLPKQVYKLVAIPSEIVDGEETTPRIDKIAVEGLYSAIGATQPSTYENSNHNNNISFLITNDGVLVFNAGGSYLIAKAIHDEIKELTDQRVKYVVLENAQGHAMLGTSYWKDQGAIIIAHTEAYKKIRENAESIFDRATRSIKDKMIGTRVDSLLPDQAFGNGGIILPMGDTIIELLHLGPSHSVDDIQLWLPQHKVLISGDTAFNERMLPVFPETDTAAWIETWGKLEELGAEVIIPGHGVPTDIETVTRFTKDYLLYMRAEVKKIIDDFGGLTDAYNIDQSAFRDWGTYMDLRQRNVERIFNTMDFE